MRWNFRDSVIYDFDLSVKKELSPPSGTPSHKQMDYFFPKTKSNKVPPLFIEEVAAWLTEEFNSQLISFQL